MANLVKGDGERVTPVTKEIFFPPDYGFAQRRARLVVLASLHGEWSLEKAHFSERNYKTVREAIGAMHVLSAGGSIQPIDCIAPAGFLLSTFGEYELQNPAAPRATGTMSSGLNVIIAQVAKVMVLSTLVTRRTFWLKGDRLDLKRRR